MRVGLNDVLGDVLRGGLRDVLRDGDELGVFEELRRVRHDAQVLVRLLRDLLGGEDRFDPEPFGALHSCKV